MTPFNPNAKCPKCGGGAAIVPRLVFQRHADGGVEISEVLFGICETCGYSWPEAPMDAKEAVE